MYARVMAKHDRLRQLLADRTMIVASATRRIDDVPTRTELVQYERRFIELYNQMGWKLEETRKYVAMFNYLEGAVETVERQVKLVNSISSNFEDAASDRE